MDRRFLLPADGKAEVAMSFDVGTLEVVVLVLEAVHLILGIVHYLTR